MRKRLPPCLSSTFTGQSTVGVDQDTGTHLAEDSKMIGMAKQLGGELLGSAMGGERRRNMVGMMDMVDTMVMVDKGGRCQMHSL